LAAKSPVSGEEYRASRAEGRDFQGESLLEKFSISEISVRGCPETGCVSAETGSNLQFEETPLPDTQKTLKPASPSRRATSRASTGHIRISPITTASSCCRRARTEAAVGIVSRFVLGRLRNRRFFSLVELNDAVRDCVTKINTKVMKHLKESRNDLFASGLERVTLSAAWRGHPAHRPGAAATRGPMPCLTPPDQFNRFIVSCVTLNFHRLD